MNKRVRAGGAPCEFANFLDIRPYENHYSAVKGYFRYKKLVRNY